MMNQASYIRNKTLRNMRRDVQTLHYASNKLKDDKEIFIEAARAYGHTIQHAPDELKNDQDMAIIAIKRNADCLQYASNVLKIIKMLSG